MLFVLFLSIAKISDNEIITQQHLLYFSFYRSNMYSVTAPLQSAKWSNYGVLILIITVTFPGPRQTI